MGTIMEILKGIPLSAVLRERLAQAEAEMTASKQQVTLLQQKIALLETENAHLKAANAALHSKLQQIDRDKTVHGDVCPYCQKSTGKVIDIKPHPVMWEAGVKVYYYQCQDCGKKYDRQKDS